MDNQAKQGASAPDGESQLGPVAHKRPGPARLRNKTRAALLKGLSAALEDMADERVRRPGTPAEWRLSGAIAYLQGWVGRGEPEIAAKLGQLLEDARSAS